MIIHSKPEGILFDLDGILLDTESLNGEAWKRAASHFKKSLSKEELINLLGRPRLDCAKDVLNLIEEDITIEELLKVHIPYQRSLIKECKAIKNAEKIVRFLKKKNIPIALVTSSSRKSVEYKISLHPWIDLISLKILGDDPEVKRGKPSPFPYLLAAKKLKLNPSNCWAVEDSASGIKSALDAKCKVWAYKPNDNYERINLNKNPIYFNKLESLLIQLNLIFN